jgi:hypothetical protein
LDWDLYVIPEVRFRQTPIGAEPAPQIVVVVDRRSKREPGHYPVRG